MPRDAEPTDDRTATTVAGRVTLYGRDFAGPGAMATEPVGDGVGLGLARGWRPKPYAYVDPNEDVVAAAVGPDAELLVVADGHNGKTASHAAVDHVIATLGDAPPTADLTDDELVDLIVGADVAAGAGAPRGGLRSRTTLVVALRSPNALQWVGVGDSALLVVEAMQARQVDTRTRWFCGDGVDRATVARTLPRGRITVSPRAWVVAATDGYTDYLPVRRPPADATRAFLRAVSRPDQAAAALLREARRGGAGDNVGVAVSAPW